MSRPSIISAIVCYVASGFLTFGYVHNRVDGDRESYTYQWQSQEGAAVAGLLWPVYWSGKAAIAVTRPADADRRYLEAR